MFTSQSFNPKQHLMVACLWLLGAGMGWSQTSSTATTANASMDPALQSIRQNQLSLFQQAQALRKQGATREAMATWHQQHAAQFAALAQQMQAWSASQPQPTRAMIQEISVPDNATPEMEEFLTNRAMLVNSRNQLSNQALASRQTALSATTQSTWQQQNATLLQRQQQLAQILAQQQPKPVALSTGTPRIPAHASPQLKAFLSARADLIQGQVAVRNQYLNSDPATRQAAMAQWREQNAAKITQMHQLGSTLAASASSTQN